MTHRNYIGWLIWSSGILLIVNSGWAQENGRARMTPELLWKLGRASGGTLNGAGTHVAYTVRRFDLATNRGSSDLHVIDLTQGLDTRVAENWVMFDNLQWAGQGENERLYVLAQANRDEGSAPQVWSWSLARPELKQITEFSEGLSNLSVAPSGQRLAFTRDIKLDATVADIYPDLPLADARIIDGLMYRHWNVWHDFSYSHLHVAELQGDSIVNLPRDLMAGMKADCPVPPFGGTEQFAWSPDETEIAYTTKITERPAESTDSGVYLQALGNTESPRLASPNMPGYDNDPVYSPNGQFVLYHSMERPGFEADRNRLMLFERQTGKLTELTAGLDQSANHAQWDHRGEKIFFTSDQRGTVQLFEMRVSDRSVRQVTQGRFNWELLALFPDGNSALMSQQSMLRPAELFQVSLRDGTATPLTHINDAIYANLELPKIEERLVEASDGKSIHCWVVYPPEFEPTSNQKWPMLTFCQGGPQSAVSQAFSFRWNFHLMASQGYVVLAPNRRGLPGFGQAWNDQISGDWGGQAMRDLLAATDDLSKESYIDRKRLGAIGASFGGYTVYWLMGNHAGRFATMISHCGVYNLESMYGSTEELFFVNWDLGGPFWKDDGIAKAYQKFSPHRFVGNWNTPLLVIHGEKDFRVPINQGMEAFTAAQVRGVPSRFLYFANEGHWVTKPQESVLWQRVFFDWLKQTIPAQN